MEPAQNYRYRTNPSMKLEETSQTITRQDSPSPRAKRHPTGFRPPIAEPIFLIGAFQPIIGKLHRHHQDLLSRILSNCDLPTILQLRLVAKLFCFASIQSSDTGSPLSNKAALSFSLNEFHPTMMKFGVKEKYDFASILNSIPENNLKLVLKVASVNELRQLQMFLRHPDPKFNSKIKIENLPQAIRIQKLLQAIKKLNFNDLEINEDSSKLFEKCLNTISNNEKLLPNLESLHIGAIKHNIETKFLKLCNLKDLNIRSISEGISLNLEDCEELESFAVKMTCQTTIKLSKKLDKLKSLAITGIGNSKIILPENIKNLTSLVIGDIAEGNELTFPNINNLKELTYSNIDDVNRVKFVSPLASVQTLTIGCANYKDPDSDFKTLILDLGVTSLQKKPNFGFLSNFPNLHLLSIRSIGDNTILELPKLNYTNLKEFSIGWIGRNATLKIPSSFPKTVEISIRLMSCWGATLDLPFFGDGEMKKNLKDTWEKVLPAKSPTDWKQLIAYGIVCLLE